MSAACPARIAPRSRIGSGRHAQRFGPGVYINEKGYLRHSAGPLRGRYYHRVVMASLCAEFCYYPVQADGFIPDGFTVEHVDHIKTHNCPENLLLLEESIHNAISRHTREYQCRCFRSAEEVPF